MNPIDINDAFDKIAVESFERFPTHPTHPTHPDNSDQPTPSTCEKQKVHKYLSKKKQGKRK